MSQKTNAEDMSAYIPLCSITPQPAFQKKNWHNMYLWGTLGNPPSGALSLPNKCFFGASDKLHSKLFDLN